jgi:DNA-binding transcriptional LysR family regulator
MARDLDTGLLRSFVSAVRAGSITRAADALGQTQPALSQQLRRLERQVGSPLLRRSPTGVSLTASGERLLPYAERILSLSSQAVLATKRTVSGQCGVGLIEDLVTPAFTRALTDFARVNPDTSLELVTAPGPAMSHAFESGRIDVALCDPTYMNAKPQSSHRLALSWAVLQGAPRIDDPIPLVLFSHPCRWRQPVLDAIERAGRTWRVQFESTNLAGIQAAVDAGLGVAPLLAVHAPPNPRAATLPSLPPVEVGLLRRAETIGDPLVDALVTLLRALI